MTRFLAPSFLVPVRGFLLAVDRAHPVAATVSPDGEVLDVVSWAREVAPPTEAAHPNRRLGIADGRVVVQDLPGGAPVSLTSTATGSLEVAPVDVTDLCWDRGERPADGYGGMPTYLAFSAGQAEEVRRLGATDVRLDVRDLDAWPVIELSFDLPGRPGVRFVQRDEPFDELGNLSGLRFLNICFAGTSVETSTAGTVAVDGRVDL